MDTNQVPTLEGHNAFTGDRLIGGLLDRYDAGWARDRAERLGAVVGDPATQDMARLANRHIPELRTHDRYGERIDEVEYHPAYHQLMALGFGHEVHSLAWTAERPGAHVARAALSYLWNQAENGTGCPLGMAHAAIPALQEEPFLAPWVGKASRAGYDGRPVPAGQKDAVTVGFAMTERQGGSDLRQNQTVGTPVGRRGPGEPYLLDGHKWFCSAPMSDAFFVLGRTEAGPSCFFVPRWRPDETRNAMHLQRLKDKCGNRSNASSELEYHGAWGWLVGDEGRGVRVILGSAAYTRGDFAVGSAGLIRHALSLALHHAEHRSAFGRPLVDHDSMRRTLADLALEWLGATELAFRVAAATDADDEGERLLARLLTPVAKYWNCKRAPLVAEEALECVGGNGYVEEHPLARLYREAPLNAIWEGTSNMMAMDVERVLDRDPKAVEVLLDEARLARGANPDLDNLLAVLDRAVSGGTRPNARGLTTMLALAAAASLLCRHHGPAVGDAFCSSRLGVAALPGFGTVDLPPTAVTTLVDLGHLA